MNCQNCNERGGGHLLWCPANDRGDMLSIMRRESSEALLVEFKRLKEDNRRMEADLENEGLRFNACLDEAQEAHQTIAALNAAHVEESERLRATLTAGDRQLSDLEARRVEASLQWEKWQVAHDKLRGEVEPLKRWVTDLQTGMFVNCVYCGHRYGPGESTPVSMADALKAHVEACPQHPMAKLQAELDAAWRATGSPVRGWVPLADVIKDHETDRDALRALHEDMTEQVRRLRAALAETPENVDAVAQVIGGLKSTSRRDARAVLTALRRLAGIE